VKYVILIHSNPQPWGHPTDQLTEEGRAQSKEFHERSERDFEGLMEEINASGEFVTALALADPASSSVYGWSPDGHLRTDGPYAETKEQMCGFDIIDCADLDEAVEIAAKHPVAKFGMVEVRPFWTD
jgi:hypothetical protein